MTDAEIEQRHVEIQTQLESLHAKLESADPIVQQRLRSELSALTYEMISLLNLKRGTPSSRKI